MTEYKLVPVVPTNAMRMAFHESYGAFEEECEGTCPDSQWAAMLAAAPAPDNQVEQGPSVCLIGARGSAYDTPDVKRAYTYTEQPGSIKAWRLGEAARECANGSAGDEIDRGLLLLKHLAGRGFGVFELGAEYTAAPDVSVLVEALRQVTDCLAKALTGGEVRAIDAGRALTAAGALLEVYDKARRQQQGGGQ